ncbi:MAG: C39 family peptidase [Candidatus Levybacteria bacterium]|nr:C39 family peptidase [Candidatus Levybacteria bacterium]
MKNSIKKYLTMFLLLDVVLTAAILLFVFVRNYLRSEQIINPKSLIVNQSVSPTPTIIPIPSSKTLSNGGYHIFQTFNNCGPAALSMALRFYGIEVSQAQLGNSLRPYQIPGGDNDDKSVTLDELGEKAKEYGFIPYHRPMGSPEIVKQFIANDMPIIARTWTKPNEDIGHYRIIKGFDGIAGTFLQDDSLQNKNLTYTYADFNEIWKKFNYEYLVLVPADKQELVERILGENADEKIAWQNAVENSLQELANNPNDIYARFNLSVAYFNNLNYQSAVEEFEKIESELPFRTLWYQIEPIQAYYELGNYDRVFEITDKVLNNYNRAFSELYILRGKIYQKQGNTQAARSEFQKAVQYNVNLKEARDALEGLAY